VRRREFITLLGGALMASPRAVFAQTNRMPRIGVLVGLAENDPETNPRFTKFRQEFERPGWAEGRNVRIDYRFAPAGTQVQERAQELIALQPDVILAHSTPVAVALRHETRTIPIVFVNVSDPIGAGLVASLARPGGNITGMLQYEEGIFGKWLGMLKEIAPRISRVALLANPKLPGYEYLVRSTKARHRRLRLNLCLFRLLMPPTLSTSHCCTCSRRLSAQTRSADARRQYTRTSHSGLTCQLRSARLRSGAATSTLSSGATSPA
jgi:putative ABC transport system substrate-binding protein